MIKFENTEVIGWEAAIRGMRNPMNSWAKSDSDCLFHAFQNYSPDDPKAKEYERYLDDFNLNLKIGPNDLDLMKRLRNAGTDHRKFMRMIAVYVDITAPLYWWKEFDTYKVGTVANSCSTMHKIHAKEFTLEDFSIEHLIRHGTNQFVYIDYDEAGEDLSSYKIMKDYVIRKLNACREAYLKTKDKKYWWQMIQLLPSSYNQKRTVMMNYEVLANIYKSRKNHKLDEWSEHKTVDITNGEKVVRTIPNQYQGFCDWIKTLPYSELITGPDIPVEDRFTPDKIRDEIMEEAKRLVRKDLEDTWKTFEDCFTPNDFLDKELKIGKD